MHLKFNTLLELISTRELNGYESGFAVHGLNTFCAAGICIDVIVNMFHVTRHPVSASWHVQQA